MRSSLVGSLVIGALLAAIGAIASADDAMDEAIKKDRKQIEGTWKIVALVVNGNKATRGRQETHHGQRHGRHVEHPF